MTTIILPTMAVSRNMADNIMDRAILDDAASLRIDSRNLDLNSESFVAQLILRVSDAGIRLIEVLGGGEDWLKEVSAEALAHGIKAKRA